MNLLSNSDTMDNNDTFYNDYKDEDFGEILNKYEFWSNATDKRKNYLYQEPSQLLLRNFISKNTIYENALLYHNLGTGKCHKKDTPILMYDGNIKMVQDIQIGDLLMGDDSKPRKVLSLARGEDEMYDIIPVKGDKYTVNQEHILCLKVSGFPKMSHDKINNYNYNIQWVENNKFKSKTFTYNKNNQLEKQKAALEFLDSIKNEQVIEISVKDYLKLSKSKKGILKGYKCGVEFTNKEIPFDPYILGYWLGDGTARDSAITTQESTVIRYLKNTLSSKNLYLSTLKSTYSYGITGNGKKGGNSFLTMLKNLNLVNNKHIPYIYKCNDRTIRLKLLAGILDADGYLCKSGGFELTQGLQHEKLIDDIIFLVRSLGFSCYKNIKKTCWIYNGEKKYGKAWRIFIFGNGIEEITTLCKRKQTPPRKQIKDPLVTGITLKHIGRDNYYGFTLDGNCRYLMGDFTVTHNTCTSISIAEGFKEWINNMGKKIFVLVKNKNIQKNFINEILSKCTGDEYLNDNNDDINKLTRSINKYYQFMTYGTFTNRVLGIKEFELDQYGYKTNRVKRVDGKIVRKRSKDAITDMNNTVIIIDEVHNITNNDTYLALLNILSKSYNYRLVLLTATPIADNSKEIFEIANLLNIKSGQLLPIRNNLLKEVSGGNYYVSKANPIYINNKVLKGGIINVTDWGLQQLTDAMYGKISYLPANKFAFPSRKDNGDDLIPAREGTSKVVYCEMSDYQYSVYLDALEIDVREDSNFDLTYTVSFVESYENAKDTNVVTSRSSALYKNSSDAATMSYPNGTFGKNGFLQNFNKQSGNNWSPIDKSLLIGDKLKQYSCKLFNLLENIESSPGNIFVYSNYVSYGGTSLIKQILLANGWGEYSGTSRYKENRSFVIFEDNFNIERRERLRKVFNSPENRYGKYIKVLIGSPVISEGITLKNVRQIHLLEPSWNMTRINQIIGRGIRNRSHEDLEPQERTVDVFKYISIKTTNLDERRGDLANFFIDREKYILSEEKDRANKIVERMLKEISFDCELTSNRRIVDMDYTADCDYKSCNFECRIKPKKGLVKNPSQTDKSTYNINITSFDKLDLYWVIDRIREIFHEYFIWNLDDLSSKIKSNSNQNVADEVIWTALSHIIDNKLVLYDTYDREGFLINRGKYYIFNPLDKDINSSFFSKVLDFDVDKNMYTLSEYMIKSGKFEKETIKEEEPPKKIEEPIVLNKEIIEYNNNVVRNNLVYGTFRKRGTMENPYGPADTKFRIVDNREPTQKTKDMRKNKSGMWIESYFKNDLIEIANWFGVKDELPLEELDKKQLSDKIQRYMSQNGLVLK